MNRAMKITATLCLIAVLLSGCATYRAQPVAPAALMNAFDARTLAAFYFSPALAIAHVYQFSEEIGTKWLAALVAITLLIAGSAHVATQHASDVLRYSPATGNER